MSLFHCTCVDASVGAERATPMSNERVLRVGLLGSEKKFRTFFGGFHAFCEENALPDGTSLQCIPLRAEELSAAAALSRDDAVGPAYPASWADLHVILHKLSDDIAAARPFDLARLVDEDVRCDERSASAVSEPQAADTAALSGTSPAIRADLDTLHAPTPSDIDAPFHTDAERATARFTVTAVLAWQQDAPGRRLVFEQPRAVALTTRRCATHAAILKALTSGGRPLPTRLRIALPWTAVAATPAEEAELLGTVRAARCDVLVKSDVACGKSASHHMRFVSAATPSLAATPVMPEPSDGLGVGLRRLTGDDMFPRVAPPPFPRVVQRAVSDADVVVKVYVLGHVVTVRIIRNGIPWLPEASTPPGPPEEEEKEGPSSSPARWFSSQASHFFPVLMESRQLPPSLCAAASSGHAFADLPEATQRDLHAFISHDGAGAIPGGDRQAEVLHAIAVTAARLRGAMGMRMFGFDLALGGDRAHSPLVSPPLRGTVAGAAPSDAEEPAVIHVLDVNYFPGYKGIADVTAVVAALVARTYDDEVRRQSS